MAAFDSVTTWKVDGLANMLVDCGMPEGHPWFDNMMQFGTRFCGVVHGVDSVTEMVEQGLSAKFMKALKVDFPEFPPMKQKKLRELLAELRPARSDETNSSVSSGSSRRGRPSKFSDDLTLEWVSKSNPHKEGSKNWSMWEAVYGAKSIGEFKSCVKMHEFSKSSSGYLFHLMKAGHVVIDL